MPQSSVNMSPLAPSGRKVKVCPSLKCLINNTSQLLSISAIRQRVNRHGLLTHMAPVAIDF